MPEGREKIDTESTRTIRGSVWKLTLLLIGSVAFTAICAAAAVGALPNTSGEDALIGYVGTGFFALATIVIFTRLVGWSRAVIVISRDGIWDQRVTRQPVLWRNVTGIGLWQHLHGSFIQLTLDAETEKTLIWSPWVCLWRRINRMLGFSGLAISAAGTDIDSKKLLVICEAYWEAQRKS
jgi:hypothetical protein